MADTTETSDPPSAGGSTAPEERWGLAIAWAGDDSQRLGEVALLPSRAQRVLGRGEARVDDPCPRLLFGQQRPGSFEAGAPLAGQKLSRVQLRLTTSPSQIAVEVLGRCPTLLNGVTTRAGALRAGDTLRLGDQLLLLCVKRPTHLEAAAEAGAFTFGAADAYGLVGESPAVWRLRAQIAFLGPRAGHVLITGDSGVGKELVARALHARSRRHAGPLLSRSAATLPESLIDAELFGHARDYPNAGVPERRGLIGEADGGTLFLDEIGELREALQAHLLRVLDSHGEYQRLGDTAVRRSDFRLLAATQRAADSLKHDLRARLKLQLHVPALAERREDIPLLLRHLLRRALADDEPLRAALSREGRGPAVAVELVEALLRHPYRLNVRELDSLLWRALGDSAAGRLTLTDSVREALDVPTPAVDPAALTAAQIQAALDACGGNRQRAYRRLGLQSRDVLYRLMKKHGL